MNQSIDQPGQVRSGEEIALDSLNKYLLSSDPFTSPVAEVGQFPGGYSNLTYLLKTRDGKEYVLRRPPFGAEPIKGGHDVAREYRVLTVIQQAGYSKIPQPILLCDDQGVIGCPFYVMERVPGVILRAQTAAKLSLTANQLRATSKALVDNLVDLHALDLEATGLNQLGKPEGYIERQVEGWHRRYLVAQTDELPVVEQLYRWLTENRPVGNQATLIHNDYKYDNLVLNPDDMSQILAVLD